MPPHDTVHEQGGRQQTAREEERCKNDASYPKKILTYRHDKQTALAGSRILRRRRIAFPLSKSTIVQRSVTGLASRAIRLSFVAEDGFCDVLVRPELSCKMGDIAYVRWSRGRTLFSQPYGSVSWKSNTINRLR